MKLDLAPSFHGARVRYPAIVEAIARAIGKGELKPGDRLPPQRDLAYRLGVAVGTVTRAYVDLERRGLVSGEVGRGTFVADRLIGDLAPPASRPSGEIDLTVNRPPSEGCARQFAASLVSLSRRRDLAGLLGHYPSVGLPRHRVAGAAWIGRTGWSVEPQQVVVCSGVQHGLSVVFAALSEPGDVVLTEELNYPGIKLLERVYHLRLQGLPADEHGLRPDAVEAACKGGRPRFLLCTPTVHNPTCAVMPEDRRRTIAAIANRYDLILIEDDIYGPMPPTPARPLASFAPERSYYVTGSSKCIGAGVRVGFLVAPPAQVNDLATAVQATTWMPTPLIVDILCRWIEDGTAEQVIDWHRREAAARQALARDALKACDWRGHAVGYHIWLQLPEPWRHEEFVAQARKAGVHVTSAEAFVIGRAVSPHAVRVSLGGGVDRETLKQGLTIVAELIAGGPQLRQVIV